MVTLNSGFAVDFGPPPADSDKKKPPVVEEFRWFAFEGVADELEKPSEYEQGQSEDPKTVIEDAGDEDGDGNQNSGNAEGVAETVYGMLMAARVLRDPLRASAISEHVLVSMILV
jgi:hypothetical protein